MSTFVLFVALGGGMAAPGQVGDSTRATMIVSLPTDAALYLDGRQTRSTSSVRTLVSPALEPGEKYSYTLYAAVLRDGRTVSTQQKISVYAGRVTRVTMNLPDASSASSGSADSASSRNSYYYPASGGSGSNPAGSGSGGMNSYPGYSGGSFSGGGQAYTSGGGGNTGMGAAARSTVRNPDGSYTTQFRDPQTGAVLGSYQTPNSGRTPPMYSGGTRPGYSGGMRPGGSSRGRP